MEDNAIISFLEDSNHNGFGFLVVVVLCYLFIFFLIQYFQHKKLFYLLYSVYAFLNGFNLLKYIDNVFFSGFFDTPQGLLFTKHTHFPTQLFGGIIFTYFLIEIMQLRKAYPKSIKVFTYGYIFLSTIYLCFCGVYTLYSNFSLISFFHSFLYIPFNYLLFFYMFYMIYKQTMKIKWYILSGMSILAITYFIITYFSIESNDARNKILYVFYIGILLESLLFALAIGLEQKILYLEKSVFQKKYISQLEENQLIKEGINRALSEELAQTKSNVIEISAEAQRERTEKLTMKFENKFSQLRLDALRSQMNPHFIFNALNSIKSYTIDNNQEKAIFYLTKFSRLIRNVLECSREEQISLEEELKTLRMYVEIENDRFKNDINYVVEIDKQINPNRLKVPALFLQPFVENAIWHGLSTKKGDKKLHIRVYKPKTKEHIEISIEDNGIGKKASIEKAENNPFKKVSLGLRLTQDRLDLFSKKTGKHYGFVMEDLFQKDTRIPLGTKILIIVPNI